MSTESTTTEGEVERRIRTAMLAWDVHHVADELGHPPRLYEYDAQGEFSSATVRDRFGTWLAALRAAGVEPDPDHDGELTPEDVVEYLEGTVAKHAVPSEVELVDSVPLTDIGKTDKKALRERHGAEAEAAD